MLRTDSPLAIESDGEIFSIALSKANDKYESYFLLENMSLEQNWL